METVVLEAASSAAAKVHLDRMLRALQGAARLPSVWNDAMRAAMDEAFSAYDAYLALVVSRHPMSCRERCTACCHDNPRGVTGIELRRLYEQIANSAGAGTTMARFAALASQHASEGEWRKRHIPCPLLHDGRCSVYATRPIACRSFVALTPAEWCSPEHPHHEDRVNPHLEPPLVLLRFLQLLSTNLGLHNAADLHAGMAALG